MNYNAPMTMAEVAGCISNASDQAIAGAGKGKPPKDGSLAVRICSGVAQNMCRTAVKDLDGALTVG